MALDGQTGRHSHQDQSLAGNDATIVAAHTARHELTAPNIR